MKGPLWAADGARPGLEDGAHKDCLHYTHPLLTIVVYMIPLLQKNPPASCVCVCVFVCVCVCVGGGGHQCTAGSQLQGPSLGERGKFKFTLNGKQVYPMTSALVCPHVVISVPLTSGLIFPFCAASDCLMAFSLTSAYRSRPVWTVAAHLRRLRSESLFKGADTAPHDAS